MNKKHILAAIGLLTILIIIDYLNIPSLLGLKISNIKLNFWIGILNNVVIILLYIITYKKIDEKAIEREKNKYQISILLFQNCYQECKNNIGYLNTETVEKFIIPKVNFNSTNNLIINNLQRDPFTSENTIMDFVKDGQVTKARLEGYFRVKEKYRQYIIMRITLYDRPEIYEPLRTDLCELIECEYSRIVRELHTDLYGSNSTKRTKA